jgi:murein DD-endopeptidase MepM/ murein hydrolase activator NlpD
MGLKHHTIILVPHSRARFRKLRISNRQLTVAASVAAILLLASAFITWSFLTNTIDAQKLAQLETENQQLRQINQEFESGVRTLTQQLEEFEVRADQLAIVAGLEEVEMAQESGIGGDSLALDASPRETPLGDLQNRVEALNLEMDGVESQLSEQLRLISSTPSIAPVVGVLTSGYGYRPDPITGKRALHRAIDISTDPGQPVSASADGIVLRAGRNGYLGNAVDLSHGYGLLSRYGHMSKLLVSAGQRVKRGETIGYVGNTGRATGYHLHYEVRVDGKPVNPLVYILDEVPGRS